jgi:hypothetical protein
MSSLSGRVCDHCFFSTNMMSPNGTDLFSFAHFHPAWGGTNLLILLLVYLLHDAMSLHYQAG